MSETWFGTYRVTATLGAGALSTIYKAVQEPLGRVVALKALKDQIPEASSFGEALDREAKILADLAHPNVVLLLDAARTPAGRPYVVLEYVDGPSLEELRAKKKKVSVPAALAIASGVAAALEHVHERGIVHRDVKPSNILLARSGAIKLVDFGIAQRPRIASVSDTLGTEGITPSGRLAPEQVKDAFGTPAYMSPEQILGDFVDGRSDLFSLGVVLYEMLSGTRPFDAPGEGGKASAAPRLRRDAPAALRERAPHVPRAVERIVMRLLEKSPQERYPSASAVLERLKEALRAETRDDPASVVRAALGEAGLAAKAKTARLPEAPRPRAPTGMRRGVLGFLAIAIAFVVGAVAIEGTSWSSRAARNAGSAPLELAPDQAGGLRVVASPWAYVRVDGQQVETTPFAHAIPLPPGKHWITLAHPEALPVEREVEIVAGETTTLDVTIPIGVGLEDAGKDAR